MEYKQIIISQLELLIEESVNTLFMVLFFFRFLNGMIKLVNKINQTRVDFNKKFMLVLVIRISGITFCHVIINHILVCLKFIISIILMNQEWRGHTPIFSRIIIKTIGIRLLLLIKRMMTIEDKA